ncbi:phage tail protein [Collimonas humicola]|uniref:phage tail protein n=1 Tax=Collimonas humicola TaxID=2825886 RepID=UPI001B8BF23A|nr:phage tail protein [Collimonas humicola]
MAVTSDEIAKHYPIPTYSFRVAVGEEMMAFSKVSGLKHSRDKIDYRDGMGGRFLMPGKLGDVDLTLTRGIVPAQSQLWKWLTGGSGNLIDKKDISISLTNEAGTVLFMTWNVRNCFPTAISAPNLDASSNEIAIEEVTLSADGFSLEWH